jgi:hypothetical protein
VRAYYGSVFKEVWQSMRSVLRDDARRAVLLVVALFLIAGLLPLLRFRTSFQDAVREVQGHVLSEAVVSLVVLIVILLLAFIPLTIKALYTIHQQNVQDVVIARTVATRQQEELRTWRPDGLKGEIDRHVRDWFQSFPLLRAELEAIREVLHEAGLHLEYNFPLVLEPSADIYQRWRIAMTPLNATRFSVTEGSRRFGGSRLRCVRQSF